MTTRELTDRNRLATTIVRTELADIEQRYGSTNGPGLIWLTYHNATHGKQVHDAAFELAQEMAVSGDIDPADVPLVRIAAAFHDHEMMLGSKANEIASAEAAASEMRKYPEAFTEDDIRKTVSMILGTTVWFDSNRSLRQAADPKDPLQAILSDADLVALGTQFGHTMALRLFIEMETCAGRIEPPKTAADLRNVAVDHDALMGFFRTQRKLLSEHRYMTQYAECRYGNGQDRNLATLEALVGRYEQTQDFGELLLQAGRLAGETVMGVER